MAKSDIHQRLRVQLARHEYPIYIGTNGLSDSELLKQCVGKQALIITNETVAPLYLESVQASLPCHCNVVILKDGERYKNQDSLTRIYDALIRYRHHRDTTLIALGGGVIGDITGFAAATYHRGIRFIQLPTTLLAQVDASIGGKTAINHPLAKNAIGAFYQPHAVIIDVKSLATLPERELRAGFGEIVKYGLLEGRAFLRQLTQLLHNDLSSFDDTMWCELIASSCHIKRRYVEADEREEHIRAHLNLGHTFAHALETLTNYQQWLHGEAVAIGLYCQALLSYELGVLSEEGVNLVDSLLARAKLPRRIPCSIDLSAMHQLMFSDKKILNKQLRFIVMNAPGECCVREAIPEELIMRVLNKATDA